MALFFNDWVIFHYIYGPIQFSCSFVANSLQPHGLQHSRLPFFIHPSADRHLGCSDVLAIVNSAAMNVGVHASFQIMVFSSYMRRNGSARSHGSSILIFWGISVLFSIVAAFPPTVYKCFIFSISSSTLVITCLFDDSHPNRWEMLSHCGFDLYFFSV